MTISRRIVLFLVVFAVLAPLANTVETTPSEAFWVDDDFVGTNTPDTTMTYRFYPSTLWYRYWAPGSNNRARMADAAAEWTTNAGRYAGFSIQYSSSSTNKVGWAFPEDMNNAAGNGTIGCESDGSYCHIWLNLELSWWNTTSGAMSYNAYHMASTLSHELGHWIGLLHDCPSTPRYGPDGQMTTMCGAGSWQTAHQRFTISQDEIQGALYSYTSNRHVAVNRDFDDCTGYTGGSACTPWHWQIRADSNRHWWWKTGGDGFVSINDGAVYPYPELIHHAWGVSVDDDNDRKFYVYARVKAYDSQTRAVLFARWEDGSHEIKCDNYPSGLPNGTWTNISCTLTVSQAERNDKYEFGIRVTDKTDIDYVGVRDT